MPRKTYTPDFKREAVRLAAESGNLSRTARELGLHAHLLRNWREQLAADPERAFPGHGNPRDEELVRLRRDVARLTEEVVILKKAVGIISSRPR
jgi:transposase